MGNFICRHMHVPEFNDLKDPVEATKRKSGWAVPRRQPEMKKSPLRQTYNPSLGLFTNFIVAGAAAVPARLAAHPFSVMRARAQAGVPGFKSGPLRSFFYTWRYEGATGFTRAAFLSSIKAFPQIGAQFTIFSALSKKYVPEIPHNKVSLESGFAIYTCGGVAGAAVQTVLHPIDVVKSRLFVQGFLAEKTYSNAADCFKKIIAMDGVAGLYRGFLPSVLGAYVFCGQMFFTWDFFNRLPWNRNDRPLIIGERIIEPWLAICIGSMVSSPLDVIRRKMMAYDPRLPKMGRVDVPAPTFLQTFRNIAVEGGLPAFLRGSFTSALKAAPQLMIFLAVYETLQKILLFESINEREKGLV